MCETAKNSKPGQWVSSLPNSFENIGLELVAVDRRREQRSQIRLWQEMDFVLAEEFATNFLDRKGPPGSGEKLRQLVQKAQVELQQGAAVAKVLQVVVGKKSIEVP